MSLVARIVGQGGVAIAPAGTVFGIIADAGNAGAVEAVYAMKGRDRSNRFLVNVSGIDGLDGAEARLAERFWPGDLTIVIGGIGYRVPSDPVLSEILRIVGRPLVSTSCNRSGGEPALAAAGAGLMGSGGSWTGARCWIGASGARLRVRSSGTAGGALGGTAPPSSLVISRRRVSQSGFCAR
jgi:L-threonylcarbamoyladenylate synthase